MDEEFSLDCTLLLVWIVREEESLVDKSRVNIISTYILMGESLIIPYYLVIIHFIFYFFKVLYLYLKRIGSV